MSLVVVVGHITYSGEITMYYYILHITIISHLLMVADEKIVQATTTA
jgi:hypothetical protein